MCSVDADSSQAIWFLLSSIYRRFSCRFFVCVLVSLHNALSIRLDVCIRVQVNLWHPSILWGFIPSLHSLLCQFLLFFILICIFIVFSSLSSPLYLEWMFFVSSRISLVLLLWRKRKNSASSECSFLLHIHISATVDRITIREKRIKKWVFIASHFELLVTIDDKSDTEHFRRKTHFYLNARKGASVIALYSLDLPLKWSKYSGCKRVYPLSDLFFVFFFCVLETHRKNYVRLFAAFHFPSLIFCFPARSKTSNAIWR